ncbi:hypothetical protein SELMODRAFT_416310 [Selaginella moellendorffii]|uniref:Uncharacterized protein n=1 Tax=Selaginella moellendorffii TaxID=88036 RepID=D8RYW1_SELML|nr:hypothetical protein SELMODRAFT_416310 [Selaginella moellendorffii]
MCCYHNLNLRLLPLAPNVLLWLSQFHLYLLLQLLDHNLQNSPATGGEQYVEIYKPHPTGLWYSYADVKHASSPEWLQRGPGKPFSFSLRTSSQFPISFNEKEFDATPPDFEFEDQIRPNQNISYSSVM